jgi:orotate phosphoribosyltransferase
MMDLKSELLDILKEKSFQKGEFILSSGRKSNFFLDCKRTTLNGIGLSYASQVLYSTILHIKDSSDVKILAAVPLGGCPLVDSITLLAAENKINLKILYVRKEKKDHGTEQLIEGMQNIQEGNRVILIEDVVTTGNSALEAIKTLQEHGLEIAYTLALIDRNEGASENFQSAGIKLYSVYSIKDFI